MDLRVLALALLIGTGGPLAYAANHAEIDGIQNENYASRDPSDYYDGYFVGRGVAGTTYVYQEIDPNGEQRYTLNSQGRDARTPNVFSVTFTTAQFTGTTFGAAFNSLELNSSSSATQGLDIHFAEMEAGPYAGAGPDPHPCTDVAHCSGTTPEPSSFLLLGTGLFGALGFSLRRKLGL